MIVYGDRTRTHDPRALLERVARAGDPVTRLLAAGELAQGVLDRAFERRGRDDVDPIGTRCLEVARAVAAGERPRIDAALVRMLPREITVKTAEGFAYYALDPALVAAAARALRRGTTVIGIRSIGTTLGAAAAATVRADAFHTLRPTGHPFARVIATTDALERVILTGRRFAIVDEGPGLSGSSFGAVADFLEDRGVTLDRIDFLPSHEGDLGPQASDRHRARWRAARRHVAPYSIVEQALPSLFEDLVGPAVAPLVELSAGKWRTRPAVAVPAWERRKYLLRTERGAFLLKFTGLGQHGERAVDIARSLGDLVVPVLSLRRGYALMPWIATERRLDSVDRRRAVEHVAKYVAARARLATDASGASPEELRAMAVHNAKEASVDLALDAPSPRPRVAIDGRLQPQEWLVDGGRIVKSDALDHHAGHDLIGAQPIDWDVAGAIVELDLVGEERARFLELLSREGVVAPDLAFYERAYVAFQLGAHTLAATMCPDERELLSRVARRHRDRLVALASAERSRSIASDAEPRRRGDDTRRTAACES